jgi:hypothetical protein
MSDGTHEPHDGLADLLRALLAGDEVSLTEEDLDAGFAAAMATARAADTDPVLRQRLENLTDPVLRDLDTERRQRETVGHDPSGSDTRLVASIPAWPGGDPRRPTLGQTPGDEWDPSARDRASNHLAGSAEGRQRIGAQAGPPAEARPEPDEVWLSQLDQIRAEAARFHPGWLD